MGRAGQKVLKDQDALGDRVWVGLLARAFPRAMVEAVIEASGAREQRTRMLPSWPVVYYVLALALFMDMGGGRVMRKLAGALSWAARGPAVVMSSEEALSRARPGPRQKSHGVSGDVNGPATDSNNSRNGTAAPQPGARLINGARPTETGPVCLRVLDIQGRAIDTEHRRPRGCVANAIPPVELEGLVAKTSLVAAPGLMAKQLLTALVSPLEAAVSV
jgi:hypothetical protein